VVEETNGTRAESTDPAMDGIDRHFALPSQDRMTVWHGLDKKKYTFATWDERLLGKRNGRVSIGWITHDDV